MKATYSILSLAGLVSLVYGQKEHNVLPIHKLAEVHLKVTGTVFSCRKFRSAFPFAIAVITSKPLTLPSRAKGARGISSDFNRQINSVFSRTIATSKYDSQVYGWEVKNQFCNCTTVNIGDKFYSFIEIATIDAKHPLPPMLNDPKSKPMK